MYSLTRSGIQPSLPTGRFNPRLPQEPRSYGWGLAQQARVLELARTSGGMPLTTMCAQFLGEEGDGDETMQAEVCSLTGWFLHILCRQADVKHLAQPTLFSPHDSPCTAW